MKRSRLLSVLFSLVLLVISVVGIAPAAAQEGAVTHESILAAIPDMEHFAEQAQQTFVGEVEGSYAYIAFVIQDNLVVIYVCDSLGAWGWFRAEVVNGEIHLVDDTTGIQQIDAAVTAEGVSGTIVLATDDDGTPTTAHEFTTAPAVPGETGLARYADEFEVAGWIVTEEGIRGLRKALDCRAYRNRMEDLRHLYSITSDPAVKSQIANDYTSTGLQATIDGCGDVSGGGVTS
jgi:hypothetical protein